MSSSSKITGLFGRMQSFYNFKVLPRVSEKPGAFFVNRQLGKIVDRFVQAPEGDRFRVVEKDWDVLIILDACRYDYYSQLFPDSEKRVTYASHSREYFKKNYSTGDYSDVVYISANGHLTPENFRKATGRDIDEVFHSVHHLALDSWDDESGTVPPKAVVERALKAEENHPAERKVVHFMQPHDPYIHVEEPWGFQDFIDSDRTLQELRETYRQSIEHLVPFIEELKENMSGKIVVTGDHGDFLGEYGMYAHPYGIDAKELREVPWHVIKDEEKELEPESLNGIDL